MGARSYPIWVEVNSCLYKSPKSFGGRDHSRQTIKVGKSAKVSNDFATVEIRRYIHSSNHHEFNLEIDGVVVKRMDLVNGEFESVQLNK